MRLGDVDNQEVDFVPVLFVELIEGGNLPPKGRSSVAAKDKDYGSALCGEVGEPNGVGVAEFRQPEQDRQYAVLPTAHASRAFRRETPETPRELGVSP